MAMNHVQFQAGLSMVQFVQQFGSEAKCFRALYQAGWPRGVHCPKCNRRPRSRFRRAGPVYCQCRACRHQTVLTSGTVFDGSKLPLTTWFLAMHLLTGSKAHMAVLELKRHLGVCYDTAWKLIHKIMQTMTEREEPRQIAGFVRIHDAYLGGERNGGKPGRGSENKQPFVVAIATDETLEHPAFVVNEPERSFDNASLTDWSQRRLAPDAEVLETIGVRFICLPRETIGVWFVYLARGSRPAHSVTWTTSDSCKPALTPDHGSSSPGCKERRNSSYSGTHLRQTGGFFAPARRCIPT